MSEQVIGFIGLGNMAQAIVKGLRQSTRYANTRMLGFDRNEGKRDAFYTLYDMEIATDACAVARESTILVLAIKPQGYPDLLGSIRDCQKERQLIISLAAGQTLGRLEDLLGRPAALVRAMPNINAKTGASMTALSHNEDVNEAQLEAAMAIFDAVGSVLVLPEKQLSAFGAIAGAGPAFAFAFLDALATAGVRAGLPRALAQQAASAMLFGSAKLAAESNEHPRALIDQVTSPGGTTIEGMHKLAELGFEHAVHEAVAAVIRKEATLG